MFTSYAAWEELVRENRLLRENFNRAREEVVQLLEDYRHLARENAVEVAKRRTLQKTMSYRLALLEKKITGRKEEVPAPVEPPFRPADNDFAKYLLEKEAHRESLSGLRFVNTLPPRPCEGPRESDDPQTADALHWIIPDFGPGAGGHQTIFRMVEGLEKRGYRQKVWIYGPSRYSTAEEAGKVMRDSFAPIRAELDFLPPEKVDSLSGTAAVATDRWSAYFARAVSNVRKKFYFIQDWEPDFYAAGSEALLTRETYAFGFIPITAGDWLQEMLVSRGYYSSADRIYSFPLAVDHRLYYPPPEPKDPAPAKPLRLVFYARMNTPRRSVELALLGLEKLAAQRQDFVVDLFGDASSREWGCQFPAEHHGLVTPSELADLYRQADLGLCLSTTNYSLIPLEMMASGCPVVELDHPCTRRVFPEKTMARAHPSPEGIADAVKRLLDDPTVRAEMRSCGLDHARSFSWEKSADRVAKAFDRECKAGNDS